MKHGWIVAAATAGVLAAVTWAAAWTSGPSVDGGKNPMKTFFAKASFTGAVMKGDGPTVVTPASPGFVTQEIYEVPPGKVFIATDLWVTLDASTSLSEKVTVDSNQMAWFPCGGTLVPFGNGQSSAAPVGRACLRVDGAKVWCASAEHKVRGFAIAQGAKISVEIAPIQPMTSMQDYFPGLVAKCSYTAVVGGHLQRN